MAGLVTIAASTYMITYSHQLYAVFEPVLGIFERKGSPHEPGEIPTNSVQPYAVLIVGLGRFGTAIGMRLRNRGISVLGVDFNPVAVRRWRELGLETQYGDATDPEFVTELPFTHASWIVSTIPTHPTGLTHEDTRTTLIQLGRSGGFHGKFAVTSHIKREATALLESGADLVLEPFQDAADRVVDLLGGSEQRERTDIPAIEPKESRAS